MALGKDDQDHKNCSEGHHHGSHFRVVSYGIQSHVNPERTLTRRLAGTGDFTHFSLAYNISQQYSQEIWEARHVFIYKDDGAKQPEEIEISQNEV